MANYLYNGMEFPTPPEWNKEKYPFAVISKDAFNYYFYITGKEINESLTGTIHNGWHCRVPYVKYQKTGNEWVYQSQGDSIGSLGDGVITSKVYWTNTDLYYNDGTLYLAASEPIPVGTAPALDPLSLFMGWKAGNWVARQRGRKRPPVAYLYNGVRLPDINTVWTDKETYPYATISPMTGYDGAYVLFLTDGTVYGGSDEDVDFTVVAYAVNYVVYIFAKEESGNTWLYQQSGTTSDSDGVGMNSKPIWCNNAVLDIDGTVFLAASEPVPVYE